MNLCRVSFRFAVSGLLISALSVFFWLVPQSTSHADSIYDGKFEGAFDCKGPKFPATIQFKRHKKKRTAIAIFDFIELKTAKGKPVLLEVEARITTAVRFKPRRWINGPPAAPVNDARFHPHRR